MAVVPAQTDPAAPGQSPAGSAAPSPAAAPAPLLRVRDLRVHFPIRKGLLQRTVDHVRAVDGVGFDIAPGECLGLVGESGCGKTTVGRAVLRLIPATSGTVHFEQTDVVAARGRALAAMRRRMQIIFQDPGSSLNPRMRIATIVGEPMQVHGMASSADELRTKVERVLNLCGMPKSSLDRYPHEFSGGQRQRIAIARALALDPKFIVCDEPTSALDVSIQAQILNLLQDLRRDLGLALLFISHDLAVIQHMCDRIAVMHAGRIIEHGSRDQIITSPREPYTRALLSAIPEPNPRRIRQSEAHPSARH